MQNLEVQSLRVSPPLGKHDRHYQHEESPAATPLMEACRTLGAVEALNNAQVTTIWPQITEGRAPLHQQPGQTPSSEVCNHSLI